MKPPPVCSARLLSFNEAVCDACHNTAALSFHLQGQWSSQELNAVCIHLNLVGISETIKAQLVF